MIDVRDLRTHIVTRWGTVKAVDGVSFAIGEGETLGLVGESGSGKSMTCLSLVRLVPRPAARILGGQVLLDGLDLLTRSEDEMREIRGRRIGMILQDPMSSLNPVFSIGMQMREPVALYHGLRGRALTDRAAALLAAVRIPSPLRGCARSRTSSRAACASGWWGPWPSRRRRGCSSRTSRPRASISRSRPSTWACSRSSSSGTGSP